MIRLRFARRLRGNDAGAHFTNLRMEMKSISGLVRSPLFYAIFAAGLACSPARAGLVYYSIQPSAISAAPGDVGDTFDVVLTNGSGSAINVAGFAFEVSVTGTDITLTGADFSTIADPYIFAGDSSDQINGFTLDTDNLGQILDAMDFTNDGANLTLTPGESLALGNVQFDVAGGAAPGLFTVSFTGDPLFDNNLSDAAGDLSYPDTSSTATITISSSTPEPVSWLLLAGGLAALGLRRVNARKFALRPRQAL